MADINRAVELATKAVELAPEGGPYWNTLGVARYRAEDWRAAIEAICAAGSVKAHLTAGIDSRMVLAACIRADVPITLIIGKYAGEQVEALQRARLKVGQVKVVTIQKERDMGVMEVMKALRSGELVAISGDRLFNEDQQHLNVSFMGHECRVPKGPYVLAGLTRAPLIPIFGIRLGKLAYRFVALRPINVDLSKRSEREATIKATAQECFDRLESMARRYPEQWYNFFKYWD